jgi:hypothetical protein
MKNSETKHERIVEKVEKTFEQMVHEHNEALEHMAHEHSDGDDRIHEASLWGSPWGERVLIDCGIARLINLLWHLGIRTFSSCQEDTDGCVMVLVADARQAVRFWRIAINILDDRLAFRYLGMIECTQRQSQSPPEPLDPTHELKFGWGWRWRIPVNQDYVWCAFPREALTIVEANLERALRSGGNHERATRSRQGSDEHSTPDPHSENEW